MPPLALVIPLSDVEQKLIAWLHKHYPERVPSEEQMAHQRALEAEAFEKAQEFYHLVRDNPPADRKAVFLPSGASSGRASVGRPARTAKPGRPAEAGAGAAPARALPVMPMRYYPPGLLIDMEVSQVRQRALAARGSLG